LENILTIKKEKGSAGEPFWCLCYSSGQIDAARLGFPGLMVVGTPLKQGNNVWRQTIVLASGKGAGLHQNIHFCKNNGFIGKVNRHNVRMGFMTVDPGGTVGAMPSHACLPVVV
jgi:hypothetical protein